MLSHHGECAAPSDLAFVHRYKNTARLQSEVLASYRGRNDSVTDLVMKLNAIIDELADTQEHLQAL